MGRFLALATAVILMGFGTIAFPVDDRDGPDSQKQGLTLTVKDWKGESIGTSKKAVLDSSTGNIVFIIASLGKEGREIAVPPGLFSIDMKNDALVLNVSKKELNKAPEYRASDLEDPDFVKKVYRFFVLVVPRTQETPEEKKGI